MSRTKFFSSLTGGTIGFFLCLAIGVDWRCALIGMLSAPLALWAVERIFR